MKLFNEEEYLAHYGVLGMKWGRRKYANHDARETYRKDVKNAKSEFKSTRSKAMDKFYKKEDDIYKKAEKRTGKSMWDVIADKQESPKEKAALNSANTEYTTSVKAAKAKLKALKKAASGKYLDTNPEYLYGKAGIKRIEKRVAKGYDKQLAQKIELGTQATASMMVVVGGMFIAKALLKQ